MRIYLIRHGRTPANERRLYCGSTDIALSEGGRQALMEKRSRGGYPDPAGLTLYTSGMRRTNETLALLYGEQTPFSVLPEFRELDFGRFEMHRFEDLKDDPEYQAWISGDNEKNTCPGGESGISFRSRVLTAFDELRWAPGDKLIVTHGGVVAVIMERLFPGEAKSRYEWQPDFGAGYALETDSSGGYRYTELPAY